MGNVCVVVSEPRDHHHNSLDLSSDGERSSPANHSSHSGHGHSSNSGRGRHLKSSKLWISLSNKRIASSKKMKHSSADLASTDSNNSFRGEIDGEYAESPVWQRSIMMGERCEPPTFSGLILYDEHGRPVQEFPWKSPAHPALRMATVN